MGYFDLVDTPLAGEQPCGPDLEGDNDFEATLEAAAGKLPASYFDFINPEKALDLKPGFNLKDELAPLLGLLKKSHDLRILVPSARLCILSGDIISFGDAIAAMSRLLSAHWVDVHPRASDGDFSIRESHLSLLTDRATVIFPLQFAPLDVTRRHGAVSFRAQLLASKAISPRAKETVLDEAAIRDALLRSENFEALKARCAALNLVEASLKQIRSDFIDNAGYERAPDFGALTTTLAPIRDYLQGIIAEREPAAAAPAETGAEAEAETADAGPALMAKGAIVLTSAAEAEAALAAIEGYFGGSEPSNPATLLIRQAQQLIGKSFIDAMLLVSPSLADKAVIKIGGDAALTITAAQMKALAEQGSKPKAAEAAAPPSIASRGEAIAWMEAVEKHFQRNEPSSPIPLLLARARTYAGKDFAMLMKEMMPG